MARMPTGSSLNLKDIWRAADAAGSKPQALFVRARLVTGAISGLGLILLPTTLLAAILLHNWMLGAVCIGVLAMEMVNLAVWRGVVIWFAFKQGYWIGWKRAPARRLEHPARFYGWTAAHAIAPATYVGAAVFLAIFALQTFASHPH